MNGNKTKILIAISSTALLFILLIQMNWIVKTAKIKVPFAAVPMIELIINVSILKAIIALAPPSIEYKANKTI